MPARELSRPIQVIEWLEEWGEKLTEPGEMILIELEKGWHVNLMPDMVLKTFPEGWEDRGDSQTYGNLTVNVPSVADLLVPKRQRNEPRDRAHVEYAKSLGLIGE